MGAKRVPWHERFWTQSGKAGPDECWLWIGVLSTYGYGLLKRDYKQVGAHRISWEIHNGQIPDGMYVCHKCDVRRCVNPAHLFLGTASDNNRDMAAKGRLVNPKGERHGISKLTECQAREIKGAPWGTRSALARRFGISRTAADAIAKGKSWKWLT